MTVLAIDPGYERLGIAVIKLKAPVNAKALADKQSSKLKTKNEQLVYSNCFMTDKNLEFSERLNLIGKEIEQLIKKYKPDAVAIEDLFFNSNQKTAMQVAQVRGVITYLAAAQNIPVYNYTPLQVKMAITGYGRSTKDQIMTMVRQLIKIEKEIKYDDEYDAVAIALTHLASVKNLR